MKGLGSRASSCSLTGSVSSRSVSYTHLAEKLDVASARAEKLREAFKAEAGTDPFTTVDELVAKLLSYKR